MEIARATSAHDREKAWDLLGFLADVGATGTAGKLAGRLFFPFLHALCAILSAGQFPLANQQRSWTAIGPSAGIERLCDATTGLEDMIFGGACDRIGKAN